MSSALVLVLAGLVGLVGTCAGAFVSVRLLRPQRQKLIAEARSIDRRDEQEMLDRYATIVAEQDERHTADLRQLEACHVRIDQLERRESDCEQRADALTRRVGELEERLAQHGIDRV